MKIKNNKGIKKVKEEVEDVAAWLWGTIIMLLSVTLKVGFFCIRGVYRWVTNHTPLIVLLGGLVLINLGVYAFIPYLSYITTGVCLVALSVVLGKGDEEEAKVIATKRVEDAERGTRW